MTEEPNKNETPLPEKLLIDEPTNFPFHAAYLVYSETFDTVNEIQAKTDLNMNIEALKQNKIDCETFYRNIAHYRNLGPMPRQDRFTTIQTQRKKDWRKKTQRQERIKRHKK
jgi:signal recognition particle GTPase